VGTRGPERGGWGEVGPLDDEKEEDVGGDPARGRRSSSAMAVAVAALAARVGEMGGGEDEWLGADEGVGGMDIFS